MHSSVGPERNLARVLVTGANGFVGRALCAHLVAKGSEVIGGIRATDADVVASTGARAVAVGNVGSKTDWMSALDGVDCVVHLAARVHVRREALNRSLGAFQEVNLAGSERLAREAAKAGVQRLVYVSSIKVNGEYTTDRSFFFSDTPQPIDAYAHSKWQAESVLADVGRQTGMEIVIVRPPLVYGPGVKGNFLALLRAVRAGWPLPLAHCTNHRSLLGLTNLVDFLARCVWHPAAAGQCLLATDGEDLSTPELVRRVARALGRQARLVPVPPSLLRFAARAVGKPELYDRLCSSLQIDIEQTRRLLDWTPPVSVDEELRRTALWFLGKGAQG